MPKKVLIITYYWPPAGGIGVVRWVKFAKYLEHYGWEPIVFTVSNGDYPLLDHSLGKDVPDNIKIIRQPIWEPYQLYRFFSKSKNTGGLGDIQPKAKASFVQKTGNWIRSNFFIPDARAFWINPSVKFLTHYLRENPVEAIVSTGPPHTAHLIALKLKQRLGISWLADFRDPWTTMDYYHELLLTGWADRKHRRLEREVLLACDAVTVVGRGMQMEFEQKRGKPVTVITNGFDETDFDRTAIQRDQEFSLVHTGTFFSRINPEGLWHALELLKKENHPLVGRLKIKLVGRVDPAILESIHAFGLDSFLEMIPYQPHDVAVRIIQGAQVLLLCVFEEKKFIVTGKLFEYLAAGNPILCIGPTDGDAAAIIRDLGAGKVFLSGDVAGIKKELMARFDKFEQGEYQSPYDSSKYSHRQLTAQVADVLNKIVFN
jgi:glycosyltransferase involved in cell wall biosynthesis